MTPLEGQKGTLDTVRVAVTAVLLLTGAGQLRLRSD